MKYKIEEYKQAFKSKDSAKDRLEIKLAEKIIEILNNKAYTYNDIDEFIKMNSDYRNFLKNNNLNTVMNHFENYVTESDFKRILQNFKLLTKKKMEVNDSKINRFNFTGNKTEEFVAMEGNKGTHIIQNNNQGLDKKIEQIQAQNASIQTEGADENTRRIADVLDQETKTLNPKYLYEINYNVLTDKEQEIFMVASFYQERFPGLIRVDLANGLIIDENNKIMKIDKLNGKFVIKKDRDTSSGIQTEIIELDNYVQDFSQAISTVAHEEQLTPTANTNVEAINTIDNMAGRYVNAETDEFINEIQANNNEFDNTTTEMNYNISTPVESNDEITEEVPMVEENPIVEETPAVEETTITENNEEEIVADNSIINLNDYRDEPTLEHTHQKTLVYRPPTVYDRAA